MATFRNNAATFPWIITGGFLCGCALMTYVLLRDGPPGGLSIGTASLGALFFWTGGLVSSIWAFRQRNTRVEVTANGQIRVRRSSPIHRSLRTFPSREAAAVELIEDKDSEGDPYYRCRVTWKNGDTLDIEEGHSRAAMESAVRRFREAIAPPQAP